MAGQIFEGGIFSGTLYASFYDETTQTWGEEKEAGNSTKFEIQSESEVRELISRKRESYGQVLKAVTLPGTTTITCDVNDPDKDVLRVAFYGTAEDSGTDGYIITGGTQSACRVKWRLDGQNLATGDPVEVTVWDSQVSPNGAVDFLSDDWQVVSLTITPTKPADKAGPYQIAYRAASTGGGGTGGGGTGGDPNP